MIDATTKTELELMVIDADGAVATHPQSRELRRRAGEARRALLQRLVSPAMTAREVGVLAGYTPHPDAIPDVLLADPIPPIQVNQLTEDENFTNQESACEN